MLFVKTRPCRKKYRTGSIRAAKYVFNFSFRTLKTSDFLRYSKLKDKSLNCFVGLVSIMSGDCKNLVLKIKFEINRLVEKFIFYEIHVRRADGA